MKPIQQMLAELPPDGLSPDAHLNRAWAEVAVLKAAAEKRQAGGHTGCQMNAPYAAQICSCGYDDMQAVLEALK